MLSSNFPSQTLWKWPAGEFNQPGSTQRQPMAPMDPMIHSVFGCPRRVTLPECSTLLSLSQSGGLVESKLFLRPFTPPRPSRSMLNCSYTFRPLRFLFSTSLSRPRRFHSSIMSNLSVQLTAPNGRSYAQPIGLFINNEFVASKSGDKIASINPSYVSSLIGLYS